MAGLPKKLRLKLDKRTTEGTFRQLGGKTGLVDFSSNDYLGFAKSEELFSKTFQELLKQNITQNGATGSRLLTGNHSLYGNLESMLSSFHKSERALVFNSGYDANIGFFGCVPQRGDFVFYDELVHASIRDGLQISHAKSYKFSHNSLADLKDKVETVLSDRSTLDMGDSEVYVITESVFSMDGDTPDLKELSLFCNKEGYHLVVDEAHAVGVFGKGGAGIISQLGLEKQVFARIITFGKALGVHGAAILGSIELCDYLTNFARSLIYTTALSPHNLVGILSSYSFLESQGDREQKSLFGNIKYFKNHIGKLKLTDYFIDSDSSIQSCVISTNTKVKSVSNKLKDDGFDVKPILYPTVPEGKERLRFCLHSYNSHEEIGLVLQLLAKYI